jgi:hypothetical protein
VVHENNAVTAALLHGTGGTCRDAPGIFAVKAGHEYVGGTGEATDHLGSYLDDLTQSWSDRQVFVGFTLNFTGMASDTLLGVLKQIVFAHSPHILLNARGASGRGPNG